MPSSMKFTFDATPTGSRMTCVTRFSSVDAMEQTVPAWKKDSARRCPNSTRCWLNEARLPRTPNLGRTPTSGHGHSNEKAQNHRTHLAGRCDPAFRRRRRFPLQRLDRALSDSRGPGCNARRTRRELRSAAWPSYLRSLVGLLAKGAAQIRVISPFRMVVSQAMKVHESIFPEVSRQVREKWVGTVHTMQGKEADAVSLILGGDPDRAWRARVRDLRAQSAQRGRHPRQASSLSHWQPRRLGNKPYFNVLAGRIPAR